MKVYTTLFGVITNYMFSLVLVFGIFALKSQKPYAFLVSFSMVSLFWFPLLHRTYERADGYDSPLLFLIGMTFEQMFFIPLTILFIVGLVVMVSTMYNKDSETNL